MPQLNSEEWEDWIEFARRDREEALSALSRGSWAEACFHAQQSCEKLLKGALLREGKFLPVHDLKKLAESVSAIFPISELADELGKLSPHCYAARYPNAASRLGIEYEKAVAEECMRIMEELWRKLESCAR